HSTHTMTLLSHVTPISSLLHPLSRTTVPRFPTFFINSTTTPELYPLSLHDALPISNRSLKGPPSLRHSTMASTGPSPTPLMAPRDRKSTRLNSSHVKISYAVFCLKKKTHRTLLSNRRQPIQTHTSSHHHSPSHY